MHLNNDGTQAHYCFTQESIFSFIASMFEEFESDRVVHKEYSRILITIYVKRIKILFGLLYPNPSEVTNL
jgi:hypothetical protein